MPVELHYLLGAALLSALLLSLGALAGFYAGQRISISKLSPSPPSPPLSHLLTFDLGQCLSGGHEIARQSAALMEAARSQATPIPTAIVNAIQRLGETTHRLVQQLDQMQRAQAGLPKVNEIAKLPGSTGSAAPDCLPLRVETKSSLTREEISVFTGHSESEDPWQSPNSQRYSYDCVQRFAPWNEGDPVPPLESMLKVRCHDISIEGISFFLPEKPEFELAVISLGSQAKPTLMVIEVRHSKVVYMHGEVQHLVGCRFVRRIDTDQVPHCDRFASA